MTNPTQEVVDVERHAELMYLQQLKDLEHYESSDCWCFPELVFVDPDSGRRVWKHHLPH